MPLASRPNLPDLLVEIGTEELPASFLEMALEGIPALVQRSLGQARLTHGEVVTWGTPRRLAFAVRQLATRQSDLSEQVTGPPARVALDAEGKPTEAGKGFARKRGVDPEALFVVQTDKGDYVAYRREEQGSEARDVLPAVLTVVFQSIPFPKTMRWGAGDVAFGRPIHWIVALHGAEVVPAEYAGIAAGRRSRGHRFLAPQAVEVQEASAYPEVLRAAHVVADMHARREDIESGLDRAAAQMGGRLVRDDFLLRECTALVEQPHVLPGSFDPKFLDLPEAVIVSVLRDHQRYFAVRDATTDGLLPGYLNVANTAEQPEAIAAGNDRVLRARLEDAAFFIREDRKRPLESRSGALDNVVFQSRLGSLGDKVARVRALVPSLLEPADAKTGTRAATLAKNDLLTLIVGEFPELQGDMGRYYALAEGEPAAVADAVRDHYRPRGAHDAVPDGPVAAALAVADRADTLVGCFGIGLVPTGSADPFALRRAALGLCRIGLEGPVDVDVLSTLSHAWTGYPPELLAPKEDVIRDLDTFIRARLRAHYADRFPGDLVDACLAAWDGHSVRDFDHRVQALSVFRKQPEYSALAVAFKRAFNISKDTPGGEVDPQLFTEDAERALEARFRDLRPTIERSVASGAYDSALTAFARELRDPIDRFFEEVFVMVDDEAVRSNRLRLLRGISDTVTTIAHFHQLST